MDGIFTLIKFKKIILFLRYIMFTSPKKFVVSRKNHFEYTLCNIAFYKKIIKL